MWSIKLDFTLDLVQEFLLKDFMKSVHRTRFLYLETKPPTELGYGFFEPVLLILCWCDFLGALYSGKGEWNKSTERTELFIKEVMSVANPKYVQAAKFIVKNYRHGSVHAYAPGGNFNILQNVSKEHLNREQKPFVLKIDINSLINDFEESVKWFAANITDEHKGSGSLDAFNRARRQLLKYEQEEPNEQG